MKSQPEISSSLNFPPVPANKQQSDFVEQSKPIEKKDFINDYEQRFEKLLGRKRLKNDRLLAEGYKRDVTSDSIANKYRGTFFTVVFGTIQGFISGVMESGYSRHKDISADVKDLESSFISLFTDYKKTRREQISQHVGTLKSDGEFVEIVTRGLGKPLTDYDWDHLITTVLPTMDMSFFAGRITESDFSNIMGKFYTSVKNNLNTLDEEIDRADMLLTEAQKLARKIKILETGQDITYNQVPNNKFDQPYAG